MKHFAYALLNFVLPGSAYIFLRERVVFGSLVLVSELILWFAALPASIEDAVNQSLDNFQIAEWLPVIAAILLFSVAFAVDAFAISKNKK